MDAIATIRQKLPFLVDLTTEDRRTMLKMGDKSRAFVSKALEVATQNPQFYLVLLMSKKCAGIWYCMRRCIQFCFL
jgi:hypothetical protein